MAALSRKSYYERLYSVLPRGKSRPVHYAMALAGVGVGACIRTALVSQVGPGFLFIPFYPIVMIVAWFGGLGPGLLATVVSSLTVWYFFLPARLNHAPPGVQEITQMSLLLISGVIFSVLMDIMHHILAEQQRLNAELYKQREWFRVTLSSIGDAVMVTDQNGVLTFMNGEAERLTGWTSVEARDKPLYSIFQIIDEKTRQAAQDPVKEVFREKRMVGQTRQTLLLTKDGSEWPIDDSAAPIYDQNGEILGVVLVFRDAAEARQAQRELKTHAEDLENKVAERTLSLQRTITELESFSYTVSHDLRSPLRAMVGYSTALMEDHAASLDAQAKDYLQRIGRAAQRLDRLILDLLSYSRLTTETISVEPIDLHRLVSDVIQQYPDLQNQSPHITIEGTLPMVLGHESALIQVVANLLGNGIKFVLPGEHPEVVIHAEPSGESIRVWFSDQGIGISPENHGRIFKMFEQVNPPHLYRGTGIGLAVVRKALEKMHGAIGVESGQGKGSRFWIELLQVKPT